MANGQNTERVILVCGATGSQGGAVARSLLDRGFQVRALTRDPQKPEAQALAEGDAEVVQGDMEDRSAMHGCSKAPTASSPRRTSGRPVTIVRSDRARRLLMRSKRPVCNIVSTARSAAPIDRPGSRTSTASGRSRSMCASSHPPRRFCVRSSLCRTGRRCVSRSSRVPWLSRWTRTSRSSTWPSRTLGPSPP
jgi:NmrA-like family